MPIEGAFFYRSNTSYSPDPEKLTSQLQSLRNERKELANEKATLSEDARDRKSFMDKTKIKGKQTITESLTKAEKLLLDLSACTIDRSSMTTGGSKAIDRVAAGCDVEISKTSLGKELRNTYIKSSDGKTRKFNTLTIKEGEDFIQRFLQRYRDSSAAQQDSDYNAIMYKILRITKKIADIDEKISTLESQQGSITSVIKLDEQCGSNGTSPSVFDSLTQLSF